MASRCSCPPSGLGDPECRVHGLRDDQVYPPMDRHSLPGEDAKQTQLRLYRESKGLRECQECGRVGKRLFVPGLTFDRREEHYWKCKSEKACRNRKYRRFMAGQRSLQKLRVDREKTKNRRRESQDEREFNRANGA